MINWEDIYLKHIDNCKNQLIVEGEIYHKHHIIPRSSGGNDNKSNLIKLTYKQHVLAHFILYKWKPTNNNWISYRLMKGVDLDKKQSIEKLKIKRIKESKNNRIWDKDIIEKRRQTQIKNIKNMDKDDFYKRFVEPMIGPKHPMWGKKRPGNLAGNFGKSKGEYILVTPNKEEIKFKNLKELIKWGMNELTVRNWVNKGIIIKNPKCNKNFKWEGYEIKFNINNNYGLTNK